MLDGGGSVCYRDRAGNGFVCDADRVIPYYLVVHLADDVSEPDTTGGQYVVTAQSGLNIRKGPGTSFDKLGGYSYGAVVAVQAVRDGWGQTDRGWVWPTIRAGGWPGSSRTSCQPKPTTGRAEAIRTPISPSTRPGTLPGAPMLWPTRHIWTVMPAKRPW